MCGDRQIVELTYEGRIRTRGRPEGLPPGIHDVAAADDDALHRVVHHLGRQNTLMEHGTQSVEPGDAVFRQTADGSCITPHRDAGDLSQVDRPAVLLDDPR